MLYEAAASPQFTERTSQAFTPSLHFQFRDFRRLMGNLQWSLNNEALAIQLYSCLLDMAPNEKHHSVILQAFENEKNHFELIEKLHFELKGRRPAVESEMLDLFCYKEGLEKALNNELESIKRYRDIYLLTPSPRIRDVYFFALADEINHAISFTHLYYEV